jgi:hypothetical protein
MGFVTMPVKDRTKADVVVSGRVSENWFGSVYAFS